MFSSRRFVGLVLVLLSTLLLLDQAAVLDFGDTVARWWPMVVVGAGLLRLWERPRDVGGALTTTAIGLLLLAATTRSLDEETVGIFWALFLLAMGAWLLLGRRAALAAKGALDDDIVDALALFSGRDIVSHARAFRGGSLTAVFGGVDLDLRNATLAPEGARLDTAAIFGGVGVTVPPGWRVQVSGPAIFGANDNQSARIRPPDPDAPVLLVRAVALFGGVGVQDKAEGGRPSQTPHAPPAPAV